MSATVNDLEQPLTHISRSCQYSTLTMLSMVQHRHIYLRLQCIIIKTLRPTYWYKFELLWRGSDFLTRPTQPKSEWPNPTRPKINMKLWIRPASPIFVRLLVVEKYGYILSCQSYRKQIVSATVKNAKPIFIYDVRRNNQIGINK